MHFDMKEVQLLEGAGPNVTIIEEEIDEEAIRDSIQEIFAKVYEYREEHRGDRPNFIIIGLNQYRGLLHFNMMRHNIYDANDYEGIPLVCLPSPDFVCCVGTPKETFMSRRKHLNENKDVIR